jgi:hypothetical protein
VEQSVQRPDDAPEPRSGGGADRLSVVRHGLSVVRPLLEVNLSVGIGLNVVYLIPNMRVVPFKSYRYVYNNAVGKLGASLEAHCMTDIPFSFRGFNNIRIKSFDINLHIHPEADCVRPTWVRFALVVQTGPYVFPTITNLLHGTTHSDNYIDMSSARDGWQNRTYALNPLYKVIYSKTIMMAPKLEAATTSLQSNLDACCNIKARVKYPKYLQYDTQTDNVGSCNNVFALWWFDDDFRSGGITPTTTHRYLGDIRTNYRVTEF